MWLLLTSMNVRAHEHDPARRTGLLPHWAPSALKVSDLHC